MRERLRVAIRGAVQGVGFRPFVHRLAHELALDGWVQNSPQGVFTEVEGEPARLEEFLLRLQRDRPSHAVIQSLEPSWLDPVPLRGFEIRASRGEGPTVALVLPDLATCADCRQEVRDPTNRRHRYPFTNCTHCGPRFSILHALPYDRANTSMRAFPMCEACAREFRDPLDRRFHAQPIACPACGPQLSLWDEDGREMHARDAALHAAVAALRDGRIVALKGLGGFQLLVDAANDAAVRRLRERKRRAEKPFALMMGELADVERVACVAPGEARLLAAPEAPIVLLRRRPDASSALAPSIAPGNPDVGVMLPCTPLHQLLLDDLGGIVVATSGNLSDEPIAIDEHEALARLRGIADLFLVHDRPIVRHVDDSIVRWVLGRELVLRRARGYAPLPVPIGAGAPPLLAVGGHLKCTVALTSAGNAIVSQHLGDLATQPAAEAFEASLADLQRLHGVQPVAVAADLHPDYVSTRRAATLGFEMLRIQHHHAHVASCMADNRIAGPVLGVAWDGTGYGTDGTTWGGEFLAVDERSFTRFATLRPFRLPGGERAVREPRRCALGVLHEIGLDATDDGATATRDAFLPAERRLLLGALSRGVNAPLTTSAGRLFDAVAALLGLCQRATFEGQAAMALEFAAETGDARPYPFALEHARRFAPTPDWRPPRFVLDWEPTLRALLADLGAGADAAALAARFHATLVEMIVAVARRCGRPRVVLTGGCFQNRRLLEGAVARLRESGLRPYWHQRVPPNDGGLSLGQLQAAAWRLAGETSAAADDSRAAPAAARSAARVGR